MKSFYKTFIIFCSISLVINKAIAQNNAVQNDTNYYVAYPDKLIITPFLAKNYSRFSISTTGRPAPINYYTNEPADLGLRLGYDFLTVSASVGLGNADPFYKKSRGKTRSLNLQTSFTGQKFLIDLYFKNSTGAYLVTSENPTYEISKDYNRHDIKTKLRGISAQYIINNKRFSVRPLKYDVRQKRSQGSFMVGFEIYGGSLGGDSVIIPKAFEDKYPQSDVVKMNYLTFGPTVQYGYTYVFRKKLFATIMGSVDAGISNVKEFTVSGIKTQKWAVQPGADVKTGIGYNTDKWAMIFSYTTNRFFFTGNSAATRYFANNNDYRLSYTRRLNAGKTIPKVVNWTGGIIEKVGLGFLIN